MEAKEFRSKQSPCIGEQRGGRVMPASRPPLCQPVHGTSFELNSLASSICLDKKSQKAMVFLFFIMKSHDFNFSRSLELKEKQETNPQLKPSRSVHLNEIL